MNNLIQFNLSGKRALVTGGASGIGLATVEILARSGCSVAINDLSVDNRLNDLVERLSGLGHDVCAVPGDVSDPESAKMIIETTIDTFGGLDYLINNAGTPNTSSVIPASDLNSIDEPFWERILSVNLLGPFWLTKAAAKALKESKGSVVNTVSVSAFHGGGSSLAYSVSKSALAGLTRELARGLAPDIRVNGIAPGLVDSPWQCKFGDVSIIAKDVVPLQTVGQPFDYANTIVFLCAGGNYITGEVIMVTGGLGI